MDGKIEVQFNLRAGGRTIEASARVPAGLTRLVNIVPVIHGITSALAQAAQENVRDEGKAISCRAGCGACCRQVVPVTEAEARYLAALVESLPPDRKERVLDRFRAVIAGLEEAGLAERVRNIAQHPGQERARISTDYFRLGLPCPFLEEESCSIHRYRPTSCRAYLVTSPAENCRDPRPETIDRVPLYGDPLRAFLGVLQEVKDEQNQPHLALAFALEWAAANPGEEPRQTGPELLGMFLSRLAGAGWHLPAPAGRDDGFSRRN